MCRRPPADRRRSAVPGPAGPGRPGIGAQRRHHAVQHRCQGRQRPVAGDLVDEPPAQRCEVRVVDVLVDEHGSGARAPGSERLSLQGQRCRLVGADQVVLDQFEADHVLVAAQVRRQRIVECGVHTLGETGADRVRVGIDDAHRQPVARRRPSAKKPQPPPTSTTTPAGCGLASALKSRTCEATKLS